MYGKIRISGNILVKTGMHIGGSGAFAAIGAVDSPIIRDARTNLPMIPGSSLKGKMRSLLAKEFNERVVEPNEDHERITRLFGSSKKKNIKKWLNRLGEQGVRDLIEVKRADKLGQNPKMTGEELQNLVTTESLVDEIIANAEPYSVKDLKINGFDLINLGFKGKEIGDILSAVLEMVIDGKLENEKDTLLKYAKEKGELN